MVHRGKPQRYGEATVLTTGLLALFQVFVDLVVWIVGTIVMVDIVIVIIVVVE